jgi:hypothetical protein
VGILWPIDAPLNFELPPLDPNRAIYVFESIDIIDADGKISPDAINGCTAASAEPFQEEQVFDPIPRQILYSLDDQARIGR